MRPPLLATRVLLGTLLLVQAAMGLADTEEVQQRGSPSRTAVTTCNGHSGYCKRSYSNITFIGSHDSPFVGELPQQNQNIGIKAQLDMGIRYLQAQTHHSIENRNVLELCHTSCFLEDAGTLESFLVTVKNWLDAHPNELVTLLLTNGDSVAITEFADAFSKSGIVSYAFVPSSSPQPLSMNDWPTLGALIKSGKRLVVFLGKFLLKNLLGMYHLLILCMCIDYGANTTKVDYILDEFAYYFETPYDVTNPSFPNCSIDRPAGASAAGRMYIVNHFLDVDVLGVKIPDREHAASTNAATGKGSIEAQATECEALYHRPPNVVLVDFVDKGHVLMAQNDLNGV